MVLLERWALYISVSVSLQDFCPPPASFYRGQSFRACVKCSVQNRGVPPGGAVGEGRPQGRDLFSPTLFGSARHHCDDKKQLDFDQFCYFKILYGQCTRLLLAPCVDLTPNTWHPFLCQ